MDPMRSFASTPNITISLYAGKHVPTVHALVVAWWEVLSGKGGDLLLAA